MILHKRIDLSRKSALQKNLKLLVIYFGSYSHLFFFILKFSLEHISKGLGGINMKLWRWVDLIKETCSAQEP